MQATNTQPQSKRHTLRWAFIAIAAISLFALGYTILGEHLHRVDDLDPQLEYIGKEKFNIISNPYYVYYFSTNMSEDELKAYFQKATYTPPDTNGSSAYTNYKWLHFELQTNEKMIVTYYENTEATIKNKVLKDTGKARIIHLTDSDYELAKKSL